MTFCLGQFITSRVNSRRFWPFKTLFFLSSKYHIFTLDSEWAVQAGPGHPAWTAYSEDQIRVSHQEEERSKFLYIHFIHLKEIFHIFSNIFVETSVDAQMGLYGIQAPCMYGHVRLSVKSPGLILGKLPSN